MRAMLQANSGVVVLSNEVQHLDGLASLCGAAEVSAYLHCESCKPVPPVRPNQQTSNIDAYRGIGYNRSIFGWYIRDASLLGGDHR